MGRSGAKLWVAALGVAVVVQAPSCGGTSHEGDAAGDDDKGGGGTGNLSGTGGVTGGRGGTSSPRGGGAGTGRGGSAGAGETGGMAGAPDGTGGAGEGGVGAGGMGSGGTGQGGMAMTIPGFCRNPVPWSINLELCDLGFVHRARAGACAPPLRDSEYPVLPAGEGVEDLVACADGDPYFDCAMGAVECTRDADCGAAGFCLRDTREDLYGEALTINHRCFVPCRTDADCGANELCGCDYAIHNAPLARVSLGKCMPADCRTDADCGATNFCISPLVPTLGRWGDFPKDLPSPKQVLSSFNCQRPGDECYGPGTCPVFDPTGGDCCPKAVCEHEGGNFACDAVETCDLCLL